MIKKIFTITMFLLIAHSPLSSKILIVDDNYPHVCEKSTCKGFCIGPFGKYYKYKKIQDALKDAAAGDTIKICKGKYYETVIADKDNLLITSGSDVTKPSDVNWNYKGTVLQIGSWSHSPANFKIENISITSEAAKGKSPAVNILKMSKNVVFDNLHIKSSSGYGIYSGYQVKNDINFSLKDISFSVGKAEAIHIEKGNAIELKNISIDAKEFTVKNYAIFLGWGFGKTSKYDFENLKLTINKGTGIKISKGRYANFKNISIDGSTVYGIYSDSGFSGNLIFKDVSVNAPEGYGILIKKGKDVYFSNMKLTGEKSLKWGIKLDWGVTGNYLFEKVAVTTKSGGGIYVAKGNKVGFNGLKLFSSGDNEGIKFDWSNFKDITITNSEIETGGDSVIINGSKFFTLESSKIASKGKNAVRLNTNVYGAKIINSCVFNKSEYKKSYAVNVYNWRKNININNNCFYSYYGYFARDSKKGHNWKGNYWDGAVDKDGDGDIDYFDSDKIEKYVTDLSPLSICPNKCGETPQLSKPVLEYRMDECLWNGSKDEVKDSTSNSYNGTGKNGATTVKDRICRSGKFDGINDYIQTDNIYKYLKGTASISFWLKTGQKGNDIAWEAPGISGIEQYGGTDDIFWGWIDRKGHIGISKGDNYKNSKSKTSINDNKWHHIVLTRNAVNGSVNIYIDGQLDISGFSDKGEVKTYFNNIGNISNTKPLVKKLHFKGEIDEFKIYDKILSKSEAEQIYKNEKAAKNWDGTERACKICSLPSPFHHMEIKDKGNDNSAIACEPELICFTAKDKENNTLTDYTGEVKIGSFLNRSSKGIWYKKYSGYKNEDPPYGELINEGHSTVGYVFKKADKGSFCIFLSDKHIDDSSEKLEILIKTALENTEDTASLKFFKSAFKFHWKKADLSPWSKQISCKESVSNPKVDSSLFLSAITTNDTTGACETLFEGEKKLKTRIIYIVPDNSQIVESPTLTVNERKITFHKENNPDNWDDLTLNFRKGEGELKLQYDDAGKIKLEFAYDLDRSVSGYEINTINSNNEIIFSPFGIFVEFENIDAKDNDKISTFSSKLKAADDAFIIKAKGVCYDSKDDRSPRDGIPDYNSNLSDNKMPLKNFHSNLKLIWTVSNPSGGSGKLTPSEITEKDFKKGIGSIKTVFSDVGILYLKSVIASDYIIPNNNITGWPLHKYFGRFIPHHFYIKEKKDGVLKTKCSSFNYSGDSLTYLLPPSFSIVAQNKNNETTKNYKKNFVFLTSSNIYSDYPSSDDNQLGNSKKIEIKISPTNGILSDRDNGILKFTFGNDKIVYLKNKNSKISPFNPKFTISVSKLKDKDGVTCINTPQTFTVSGQQIKYGKLDISDNYGPETENLKLRMKTFFWNNETWELNSEDSCTAFDKSDFILKNFTDKLSSGDTSIVGFSNISKGLGDITLSAPGQNNYGSVEIDWTSNTFLHEKDSYGKATFGLYRGRDRIIMWEEVPSEDK